MKSSDGDKEVDNKTKAGTAWSHSYLNQKPWHPLSYPNQRRKWIAEQTEAQKQRKADEVAREYAKEQEFFRQSAMLSKKEQEKAEVMQGLSFMYMRPPGYNAELARLAEIADERKRQGIVDEPAPPPTSEGPQEPAPERKRRRVLDIYGRPVPTEEEFPALKNAPRLETGVVARPKPFGVEIRNVRCARCGAFGHQSGDRECALKDVIMPNEQARLKRDDPLTALMNHDSQGDKWELKQRLGTISPPRGGCKADDPNQQMLADEIYDEYGGFLADGDGFADMIAASLSKSKNDKRRKERTKKKKKHRSSSSASESSSSEDESDKRSRKKQRRKEDKKQNENRSSKDRGDGGEQKDHGPERHHKQREKRRRDDDRHNSYRNSVEDDEDPRREKKSYRHDEKHRRRAHSRNGDDQAKRRHGESRRRS